MDVLIIQWSISLLRVFAIVHLVIERGIRSEIMQKENRACKVFKQRTDVIPCAFINEVTPNCGNCRLWSGKKCISEEFAVANQVIGRSWAVWLLW